MFNVDGSFPFITCLTKKKFPRERGERERERERERGKKKMKKRYFQNLENSGQ